MNVDAIKTIEESDPNLIALILQEDTTRLDVPSEITDGLANLGIATTCSMHSMQIFVKNVLGESQIEIPASHMDSSGSA